jgi:hypothetical protein
MEFKVGDVIRVKPAVLKSWGSEYGHKMQEHYSGVYTVVSVEEKIRISALHIRTGKPCRVFDTQIEHVHNYKELI